MLQSVKRALAIAPDHPWLHQCLVRFFKGVSESTELPQVVRTVLKQEITRLFGDSNAMSFNQAYLTKHSNSIPHRLAAAKMMVHLDSSTETKAAALASALDESLNNRTIQVLTWTSGGPYGHRNTWRGEESGGQIDRGKEAR
ncbi:N-alpha-acetyltransferase 15, NatA auxiliary subunit [Liparis tanakae]|uniref:N-alpha-acetyltransferase 15, NatA auxiliary subunit n=1 Tax=Liparis tanakae TaxID=230148 RepID=A0A4Z2E5B1_9TELE|nr:N-alpha-acetyltransferase 15, NatA auxiliary subunit [Liparis tanakae]